MNTRQRVTKELRALGFRMPDSSANFLFVTHDKLSMKEMFEYLKEKKVFIRYFAVARIDNYVRITVGTDDEMDVLLKEIRGYIDYVKA